MAFRLNVTLPATILPFARRKLDRRRLGPDQKPNATPPALDVTLRQGAHIRRYRIATATDDQWYAWIWLDEALHRGIRTADLSAAYRRYAEFICEVAELSSDGWKISERACDTDGDG